MQQLTIRLTEELHADLKAVSIAEGRPMAEIVRTCVEDYTQTRPVEEMKELIAAIRSLKPITKEEALADIDRIVELDDTPGIGIGKAQIGNG